MAAVPDGSVQPHDVFRAFDEIERGLLHVLMLARTARRAAVAPEVAAAEIVEDVLGAVEDLRPELNALRAYALRSTRAVALSVVPMPTVDE